MTEVTPEERLAQIAERLGRERYERRGEGARGYGNGFKERRLDTVEGRIGVWVPQVRDTEQPFRLQLWEAMQRRTEVLERLVVEMYARGGRPGTSRTRWRFWRRGSW